MTSLGDSKRTGPNPASVLKIVFSSVPSITEQGCRHCRDKKATATCLLCFKKLYCSAECRRADQLRHLQECKPGPARKYQLPESLSSFVATATELFLPLGFQEAFAHCSEARERGSVSALCDL